MDRKKELQEQTEETAHVKPSYLVRREEGFDIIVEKYQPEMDKERLAAYCHELCKRQNKDV